MKTIMTYAEGILLVVKDFPLLELLHATDIRGVSLIVCPTILIFFGAGS